jgi:exopolyphosphatase/guanosine-5'-triphosphate,3'-diphosphate pyrophosphatase
MSKVAVIDLGTNTFNLLIVEVNPDSSYQQLFQTKISVKLAEGGINKGFIAPIPFQRGIDALKKYKKNIENYKVDKVLAFATSAIRGASNGTDFITQAMQQTGININVISGDKEAELIYYGVRSAVEMDEDTALIIDIGGGSTEFIIANKNEIFWKQSFLLGAARLLEMFSPSDPITEKEIHKMNDYLLMELQPLLTAVKKYPITELIGSSGSFDSLAEMLAYRFYSPDILVNKTEYTFDLTECSLICESILKSTSAERLNMKGLVAMRVDMIVISTILVRFILSALEIKKMRLSTYSLKEGVLYELMNL